MAILLLTRDLSVISQVDGVAARIGAAICTVSGEAEAVALCAGARAELMVVDLSTPSLNLQSLVEQVRAATTTRLRIVAFGPHVHGERLEAARQAGCDEVISRGQFFSQLDAVLSGVA